MINTIHAQDISLNGEWDFITDPERILTINSLKDVEWRNAIVPMSWQSQFEDLRDYQGVGWYRRSFDQTGIDLNKVYIIKFNAVDYVTKVYVNKQFVGENEGGYTPFEFDITEFLRDGENEIVLRVMDPLNEENPTEGISFWYIPHGKQTWYVQNSGIWQSVSLLIKSQQYIKQLHITPSINGRVLFNGLFNKSINNNDKLDLIIYDPNGKKIISKQLPIDIKANEFSFSEDIPDSKLWSFENPYLYQIELRLGEDYIKERFGFRSIEARDNKLYLNGEPFYLIAALDQDFYPETIYTTPSEEYIRDEMIKAKKLGLNMLRCHIKVPDPVYLKIADEIGLLVWYELPNWGQFKEESAARGSKLMDKMLERDWNHPSLVILSLINESWGIDLQKEEQRQWLLTEFDRIKEKAVGRLVVDNSACWGNFHLKTDINDYHTYWAIPENKNKFDKTIEDFAARPKWLFSEFGDSKEKGDEPLLISEFGNWGLPKLPEKLPWWFERQFLDIEVSLPLGVHKRFTDHKLDKIFGSYNNLAEESQRAQFNALKYEIEKIRMTPEIQGYVITEFTDINWESNGLLDMWRNFKVYSEDIPLIQQQDVIIPRPVKYNYWSGEEVNIQLYISQYSGNRLSDLSLEWNLKEKINGIIKIDDLKNANVTNIKSLKFTLPEVSKSEKIKIDLKLIDKDKNVIAKNYVELFLFDKNTAGKIEEVFVYNPNQNLNQFNDLLGRHYNIIESSSVTITNSLDEKVFNRLRDGESIICLIDSSTILPDSFPFEIKSREEEWLDGNWATNFNWLRDENILFDDVSFGKAFGFEIAQTSPKNVITEIPKENFMDVLSGMYVGWLHKHSAYIVQMKVGNGNLILCTFPLAENYSRDPFALKLMKNIISYIKSDTFKPQFTLTLN
jgi:hypothetical protein